MRTIGTDAEFFIVDHSGMIVPPAALRDDYKIEYVEYRDKHIVFTQVEGVSQTVRFSEDGAAVELYTEPYTDPAKLYHDITMALNGLSRMVTNKGLHLSSNMIGTFDLERYWKGRDNSFLDCVRIGCNPDTNIYVTLFNQEPSKERRIEGDPFRFAGGHLQMSTPEDNPYLFSDNYIAATVVMDALIGTKNVCLERQGFDVENEKRRLIQYGHPGRIRLQNYPNGQSGIEYRPPSNKWCFSKSTDVLKLYGLMEIMSKSVELGKAEEFFYTIYDDLRQLYNGLVEFDTNFCADFHNKTIAWFCDNNVITPKQLSFYKI